MDSDGPSTVFVTIDAPVWHAVVETTPSSSVARPSRRPCAARRRPRGWRRPRSACCCATIARDARAQRRYRQQDRATNVLSFPALELDPDAPPAARRPAAPGVCSATSCSPPRRCAAEAARTASGRPIICATWWCTAACICSATTTRTTPARGPHGGSGTPDPARARAFPTLCADGGAAARPPSAAPAEAGHEGAARQPRPADLAAARPA